MGGVQLLTLVLICCCVGAMDDVGSAWRRRRRAAASSSPLRIHFDIIDSDGATSTAQLSRVNIALSSAKAWVERRIKLLERGAEPLRVARACANSTSVFSREDTKSPDIFHYYCRSLGCSNITPCGPLKAVPEKHLGRCQFCEIGLANCRQCISCRANASQPLLEGIPGADLVVYVLLDCSLVPGDVHLASGDACLRNATTDRPNAGWIAVCPTRFSDGQPTFQVAEVLRELFRVLGLSRSQMGFWRDSNAERPEDKRTPRDSITGLPKGVGNSTLQKFDKMVETRTGLSHVEGRRLITPSVVAEARRHFNCPSLQGMEVEDFNDSFASWEKRLVGPFEILTESSNSHSIYMRRLVSRLTLAALQDTGWYDVDLSQADPLLWGKDHGCVFASRGCLSTIDEAWNISSTSTPNYTALFSVPSASWARVKVQPAFSAEQPFCRYLPTASDKLFVRCYDDGRSLKACNLQSVSDASYRYFTDKMLAGSDRSADDCPYLSPLVVHKENFTTVALCQDHTQAPSVNWALEQYGHSSICVSHGLPWRRRIDTSTTWELQTSSSALYIGGGCYRRECLRNGSMLIYIASVGLLCRHQDQVVNFSLTVRGVEYVGQIVCPALEDHCPVVDCANNCNWRGQCLNDSSGQPHCVCDLSYHGDYCQLLANGEIAPTTHSSFHPDISKDDTLFTATVIANISATATVLASIVLAIYLTQCRSSRHRRKKGQSSGGDQDGQVSSQPLGYTPLPDGVSHLAVPPPEVRTVTGASYPRQSNFDEIISETRLMPSQTDGYQVGSITHSFEPLPPATSTSTAPYTNTIPLNDIES